MSNFKIVNGAPIALTKDHESNEIVEEYPDDVARAELGKVCAYLNASWSDEIDGTEAPSEIVIRLLEVFRAAAGETADLPGVQSAE